MSRVVRALIGAALALAGALAIGWHWKRYRRPAPVPAGRHAPPLVLQGIDRVPVLGYVTRLKDVITELVRLVEKSAKASGEVFTIRVPFTCDVTYLVGADAYRTVMRLPADHATIGPLYAKLPTVGYWFPRSQRDTDSLQRLVLLGRQLMAGLLTRQRIADLESMIPAIAKRHVAGWRNVEDLTTVIHPVLYEAAIRSLAGDAVWADIGADLVVLSRHIADGVDIPHATLAKTPLRFTLPEYKATRLLATVLQTAVRHHHPADSPLLLAIDQARLDGARLSGPDAVWMVMYVLWNATTYPGSYGFWTLLDIVSRPELLESIRTTTDPADRRDAIGRCLLETIRLNPVSALARSLSRSLDYEQDGKVYQLAAGSLVGVFPRGINLDSATVDKPDQYRPDRHLTAQPNLSLFGRGAFGCVAQQFTQTLVATALRDILDRSTITLLDPEPQRRCRVHLTYPDSPVRATIGLYRIPGQVVGPEPERTPLD
jgi:cytochrome P450